MRGDDSLSVALGFMQRNWFRRSGVNEGWPHSEPAAQGIFQCPLTSWATC